MDFEKELEKRKYWQANIAPKVFTVDFGFENFAYKNNRLVMTDW